VIAHVIAMLAVIATPPATYAAVDAVDDWAAGAWHRYQTRRFGRMLQRPYGGTR
jgi:hypothetical protein